MAMVTELKWLVVVVHIHDDVTEETVNVTVPAHTHAVKAVLSIRLPPILTMAVKSM